MRRLRGGHGAADARAAWRHRPNAAVIVATARALKMHGGGPPVVRLAVLAHHRHDAPHPHRAAALTRPPARAPAQVAGTPLAAAYRTEDVALVSRGCCNLIRHIANTRAFGIPVVVCINRFACDTDAELAAIRSAALAAGAADAVVCTHHGAGGAGAAALASAVAAACEACPHPEDSFRFTYALDLPIKAKIEAIARSVYGAADVSYLPEAEAKIELYTRQGFAGLPICMAKTQYSFSHDATAKGAPAGFTLPVRDVRVSAGAGFLYPLVGEMPTIPGLPTRPVFYDIDIDTRTGKIVGLS
jgi:formate--tetrahydrofolate ligase